MSEPIWPVVIENLAEQISATQGGILHPVQMLPYLPISLGLAIQCLDDLVTTDRVERRFENGLITYLFYDSSHKAPSRFLPKHCVYSNDPLPDNTYSALSTETRKRIEAELGYLATNHVWPAEANWQHELIYLINNLPAPVSTSDVAGHSRIAFKRVEIRLAQLQQVGAIRLNKELGTWELPPMRYPTAPYKRNDAFIRQFPGALKEEVEIRLVKALSVSLIVLLVCFILAVSAKFPFPILLFGGLGVAAVFAVKIFRTPPGKVPDL